MTKKDFLKRIANLESVAAKTRRRREFDFSTMSAAQLWSLSIRVGELRGFKQYYWEIQSLTTGTPPPFVDLPLKLDGLTRDELIDIFAAVRSEVQKRYVGDVFSIEAQLHAAALAERLNLK